MKRLALSLLSVVGALLGATSGAQETWKVQLRSQVEIAPGQNRYQTRIRAEDWRPAETAIIVCDVWDYHHCLNAVRRIEQFAPRLNEVLRVARERGTTIIHAPSDCMPAYADHPARQRAMAAPAARQPLPDAQLWCSKIPAEEQAAYPIDQSDGGEDDDPREHAAWAAKLKSLGRNPSMPWQRQSDLLTIDAQKDFLSDRGDEVWNILEQRGIRHVILTGVHTNMCVLGRPFGLRQMVRGGRQVVLMRDMTDCMYNPARWPYVSHFTGNDLIISHVERFVCPTITSAQILGGQPFRFAEDKRPHLVIIMAEAPYQTARTLPDFAARRLGRDFRVTYVYGSGQEPRDIPGLDVLDEADVALVSVRRRVLRPESLAAMRRFVQAGKAVLGIRTASHAFQLRDEPTPEGYEAWPEFDAQVFGGNYHGHPAEPEQAILQTLPGAALHPILTGVPREPRVRKGSLYLTGPLAAGAELLIQGTHQGQPPEPVAWTFHRQDGGRSFYVSLGEPPDFEDPAFERLLYNALLWSINVPVPRDWPTAPDEATFKRHWSPVSVPGLLAEISHGTLADYRGRAWYRCVVRVPADAARDGMKLTVPQSSGSTTVWVNGVETRRTDGADGSTEHHIAPEAVVNGDANLIVLRIDITGPGQGLTGAPTFSVPSGSLRLAGRWQLRLGDEPGWSNMPLPAKFGTITDIVFP